MGSDQPKLTIGQDLMASLPGVLAGIENQLWRLNNLYWIVNDHGVRLPFRLRPIQEQFLRDMHYRNSILKSRQHGFCLDPSTRILTADLRWVPINSLRVGDELVGVDEYTRGGKGSARKMRTSVVEAIASRIDEAYRITFDDGRQVICTEHHRWLTKMGGKGKRSDADWRSMHSDVNRSDAKKVKVGARIRSITSPWSESDFDDGWMGGMIDGEGTMSNFKKGASMRICQRENTVLDRLHRFASDKDYHPTKKIDNRKSDDRSFLGNSPVHYLEYNRLNELFRLIGQTRPTRFIDYKFWETRELPGKKTGIAWNVIVDIEPLGLQPVIDLQTSTSTFIAEGFVSHNSSLIAIWSLDCTLFYPNITAAIVAQTQKDTQNIFETKVEFPFKSLPDGLRNQFPVERSNLQEMKFEHNNSKIMVTQSARSGTTQILHISEFGKISKEQPLKAKEIRTGGFPTSHKGSYIFVESTAEGSEGEFYDLCQQGMADKQEGIYLTPLDFKFHFYAWHERPDNRLSSEDAEQVSIPARLQRYFDELYTEHGIKTDLGQRAWYVITEKSLGDEMMREHPSHPEEAFNQATSGTYFAREMARTREEGRICEVPYTHGYPVQTAWDLGINDEMALVFFQKIGEFFHIIHYYENTDYGLDWYIEQLFKIRDEKKWQFGKHWAPHDITKRELSTAVTTWQQALNMGVRFEVVPKPDRKSTSIQAARQHLSICKFDKIGTGQLVKHLDNYRKQWDEIRGTWKDLPLHSRASNGADAFQTMALAVERMKRDEGRGQGRKDPRNQPKDVNDMVSSLASSARPQPNIARIF